MRYKVIIEIEVEMASKSAAYEWGKDAAQAIWDSDPGLSDQMYTSLVHPPIDPPPYPMCMTPDLRHTWMAWKLSS